MKMTTKCIFTYSTFMLLHILRLLDMQYLQDCLGEEVISHGVKV